MHENPIERSLKGNHMVSWTELNRHMTIGVGHFNDIPFHDNATDTEFKTSIGQNSVVTWFDVAINATDAGWVGGGCGGRMVEGGSEGGEAGVKWGWQTAH